MRRPARRRGHQCPAGRQLTRGRVLRDAEGLRTKLIVGELSPAEVDLVTALVHSGVSVDPRDVPTLRWLLESAALAPDTPADLADRLVVR